MTASSRWHNLIPALLLSIMLVIAGLTASGAGEGIAADLSDGPAVKQLRFMGPCPHDHAGDGCCLPADCAGPGLLADESRFFLSALGADRVLHVSSSLLSADRYGFDRPPKT